MTSNPVHLLLLRNQPIPRLPTHPGSSPTRSKSTRKTPKWRKKTLSNSLASYLRDPVKTLKANLQSITISINKRHSSNNPQEILTSNQPKWSTNNNWMSRTNSKSRPLSSMRMITLLMKAIPKRRLPFPNKGFPLKINLSLNSINPLKTQSRVSNKSHK